MAYSVKILADSISSPSAAQRLKGVRLTTFELTYPRFVHAELMTHRLFSRNSASSRAIPTQKLLQRIKDDPVFPREWGRNQKGMQAGAELDAESQENAKAIWLEARSKAIKAAEGLHALGVHKQLANRVLEPWMFITVIVSATEWDNWFHLRDSEFAQPEIAWVARRMKEEMELSTPRRRQWHLPLVELEDDTHPLYVGLEEYYAVASLGLPFPPEVAISVARCARVSYLTHDGQRDLTKDMELFYKLRTNGHWSPFEHAAKAAASPLHRHGNFYGWVQARKFFDDEHVGRSMR